MLREQFFDAIPIGLFLVNKDRVICAWNKWMVSNTKIRVKDAMGESLTSLYPDYHHPRFDWALETVLTYGYPQILSTSLNRYIIPIPVAHTYPDLDMMQQSVEILPFHYHNQTMALVMIQDVSDKIHLKNTLITMASRFEKSSLLDSLTGLYNRRFLWKYLDNELQMAEREGYNVICCLFDLDHFKQINDEFGHNAGDEVLCSFAKIVTENMRPGDQVIRYGGEEFIGILSRLTIDDAVKQTIRICKVFETTLQHGSVKQRITCSAGIAFWQPSDPVISAEKLVNQADLELYRAKEMGRNCIVVNSKVV